jgi:hypothetical protein
VVFFLKQPRYGGLNAGAKAQNSAGGRFGTKTRKGLKRNTFLTGKAGQKRIGAESPVRPEGRMRPDPY